MIPFAYPKSRHVRTKTPKRVYATYRTYKKPLRAEFFKKCVYCRMPDPMKGYEAFGVDHYRPKEDFPALIVSYPNLYYCCNTCNSHKSRYWPESALQLMRFIPNPCDHIMFEHMKFVGYEVIPRTSAGRWTVDLLDLNDPEVVAFREFIVETIERYVEDESRLQRLEEAVHDAERSGALSATDAQAKLLIIGKKMFNVRKHLARLRGS